jgi:tetratricopeptide (TPR) repeat protein
LGDLEYTIGAFPNHHQALYSMVRYATEKAYSKESNKAWSTQSSRSSHPSPPPECYLQRAIAFAPQDERTRLLYGIFLHRVGAFQKAEVAYERALEIAPESPEIHYNFGLLLFDMEQYRKAANHARKAYEQGYPLQGLRKQLRSEGYKIGS